MSTSPSTSVVLSCSSFESSGSEHRGGKKAWINRFHNQRTNSQKSHISHTQNTHVLSFLTVRETALCEVSGRKRKYHRMLCCQHKTVGVMFSKCARWCWTYWNQTQTCILMSLCFKIYQLLQCSLYTQKTTTDVLFSLFWQNVASLKNK